MTDQLTTTKPPPARTSDRVTCSTCHSVIGYYWPVVNVNGGQTTMLKIGGVILRHASGNCAVCGEEWRFSYTDKIMEKLISRKSHLQNS